MATYAIGDLQGCYPEFQQLLRQIRFTAADRLWLVGDLINRGSDSLATLRCVYQMQDRCQVVLGNHDLHFLAIYFGGHNPSRSDTYDELLDADDVDELAHWLRQQKLIHVDEALRYVMVHAGIPHIWSLSQARALAGEVEQTLQGADYVAFLQQMYGNEPDRWQDHLAGLDRLRLITNYFTRMRLIGSDGRLEFKHKGEIAEAPEGWQPWFSLPNERLEGMTLLFGHWASLLGKTGLTDKIALDTGCVWGRQLTAYCLETAELSQVQAIPN